MTFFPDQPTDQKPVNKITGFFQSIWIDWFNQLRQSIKEKVDGTGTANTMTKWSDTDTITDSVYTETQLRARLRDYDEEAYTTTSGDVTQVLYKRLTVTLLTEARTYNAYGHIATATFTGDLAETWTYSYASDNFTPTGILVT